MNSNTSKDNSSDNDDNYTNNVKNGYIDVDAVDALPGDDYIDWIKISKELLKKRERKLMNVRVKTLNNILKDQCSLFESTNNVKVANISSVITHNLVESCLNKLYLTIQHWNGVSLIKTKKSLSTFRKYFVIGKCWFDQKKKNVLAPDFWIKFFYLLNAFTDQSAKYYFNNNNRYIQQLYSKLLLFQIIEAIFCAELHYASTKPQPLIPCGMIKDSISMRQYFTSLDNRLDFDDHIHHNNVHAKDVLELFSQKIHILTNEVQNEFTINMSCNINDDILRSIPVSNMSNHSSSAETLLTMSTTGLNVNNTTVDNNNNNNNNNINNNAFMATSIEPPDNIPTMHQIIPHPLVNSLSNSMSIPRMSSISSLPPIPMQRRSSPMSLSYHPNDNAYSNGNYTNSNSNGNSSNYMGHHTSTYSVINSRYNPMNASSSASASSSSSVSPLNNNYINYNSNYNNNYNSNSNNYSHNYSNNNYNNYCSPAVQSVQHHQQQPQTNPNHVHQHQQCNQCINSHQMFNNNWSTNDSNINYDNTNVDNSMLSMVYPDQHNNYCEQSSNFQPVATCFCCR